MSESPSVTVVNRSSGLTIAVGVVALLASLTALYGTGQNLIQSQRVQNQSETITRLRWSNGDSQADNAALQARIDALDASKDQTTTQIAGLKKRVSDLSQQAGQVPGFEAIIADLNNQVSQLEATVAGLTKQLDDTKVALADARAAGRRSQEKVASLSYTDFVQDAELQVCGKGPTNKVKACRASVVSAMQRAGIEGRFGRCQATGQATPMLTQDVHARNIELVGVTSTTNPHTYYVLPCDETLPEAEPAVADGG